MRPVVFLDLDDVLAIHRFHTGFRVVEAFSQRNTDAVPDLWLHVFDAAARRNLETLHEEFEPNYVISSSWASYLGREEIIEVLERTSLQFVVSNLHKYWCTPRDNASSRLSEISKWLELHLSKDKQACIIIDDHLSGATLRGSRLEKKVVFCDAWVGFNYPKLRIARKILREQMSSEAK